MANIDKLLAQLNDSQLQIKDNPLYQVIKSLISEIRNVSKASSSGSGGGSTVVNNITNQISPLGADLSDGNVLNIPVPTGQPNNPQINYFINNQFLSGELPFDLMAENNLITPAPLGSNVNRDQVVNFPTPFTVGDMFYANGTTTIARLPAVALGQVIISQGVATAPIWSSSLSLSGNLDVTGTILGSNTFIINFRSTSHSFTGSTAGIQVLNITSPITDATCQAEVAITTDGGGTLQLDAFGSTFTTSGPAIASGARILSGNVGGLSVVAKSVSGAIRFYSGGETLRGVFSSSGNFGVGASLSPASLITIDGDTASNNPDLRIINASGRTWRLGDGLVTNGVFSIYDTTAAAARASISSTGLFGIGTAAPSSLLTLSGDAASLNIDLRFINTNASGGTWRIGDGVTANGTFTIFSVTAATSRFAIDSSGNITIGGNINGQTISSAANFTGTVAISGAVTSGTINGQTISSTASFTGTVAVTGNATFSAEVRMSINNKLTFDGSTGQCYIISDSAGQVSVFGTATKIASFNTGAASILGVFNDTTASGPNVFVTTGGGMKQSTSSRKIKYNIKPLNLNDAIKVIDLMNTYTFNSKLKDDGDKLFAGCIAEEMHEICPMMVYYNENNEPIGINYSLISVYLATVLKGMKEFEHLKKEMN